MRRLHPLGCVAADEVLIESVRAVNLHLERKGVNEHRPASRLSLSSVSTFTPDFQLQFLFLALFLIGLSLRASVVPVSVLCSHCVTFLFLGLFYNRCLQGLQIENSPFKELNM